MNEMKQSALSETQVRIIFFIAQIWSKNPTLRFNQLVDNLQSIYSRENGDNLKRTAFTGKSDFDMEVDYVDAFYLEDVLFLKWLESYVVRIGLGIA